MENPKKNSIAGIFFSLRAGSLWGIVPVYIKFIDLDDPYEIVAHRSRWSAVLLFIICLISGQLGEIWVTIKQHKNLLNFFSSLSCVPILNSLNKYAEKQVSDFKKDLSVFFFKQMTAYEIRLSLVGSEMCIRDRV